MTDPTEAIRKAHAAYAATGVLSPERRIALDDFYAACNPAAIRALLDRLDSAERALVDCKVKIVELCESFWVPKPLATLERIDAALLSVGEKEPG